jgi:hypothetical protein
VSHQKSFDLRETSLDLSESFVETRQRHSQSGLCSREIRLSNRQAHDRILETIQSIDSVRRSLLHCQFFKDSFPSLRPERRSPNEFVFLGSRDPGDSRTESVQVRMKKNRTEKR